MGEPARERSDGVAGPEYSALVIGLGPEAMDERRERDTPGCMIFANDCRLDPGRDGYGDVVGDASEGKAGPALS